MISLEKAESATKLTSSFTLVSYVTMGAKMNRGKVVRVTALKFTLMFLNIQKPSKFV